MPHIGQRMIKTSFAIFVCLIIYRLLGYEGDGMSVEAVITAIICMQPFLSDSRTFAFNRFFGTLIGALWGMLFLLLLYNIPILGRNFVLLYALMAIGALLSVYTAVTFNVRDSSGLSAIVFMCIVIQFPDIDAPQLQVAERLLGVFIGTTVAITVNLMHLPRDKKKDRVFFVKAKDLTPDRFSQVPASVLFHLNRLYEDGAKICIILEHAPAFFTMQMNKCHLNIPMIVMDGAAIFDTNENRYLYIEAIQADAAAWLGDWLQTRNIGFFTYHIRKNRTCILHNGDLNESEILILKQMQSSPYRNYLIGDDKLSEASVYFKIVDREDVLENLKAQMDPLLEAHSLRSVIRSQAEAPGVGGLYIYSTTANWHRAQQYLLFLLKAAESEELYPVNIFSSASKYSERETTRLLHRLIRSYEPVSFLKYFKHSR